MTGNISFQRYVPNQNTPITVISLLKTTLFQFNFSPFLRVRTRAATRRSEAIATLVPTNAIAFTNFHANACLSEEGVVRRGHVRESEL